MENNELNPGATTIIHRIQEKLKQQTAIENARGEAPSGLPEIQKRNFRDLDTTTPAQAYPVLLERAFVWNTTPFMDHYPPFIRPFAKLIGKIVLYLGQVITKQQQAFNLATTSNIHSIQENLRIVQQNFDAVAGGFEGLQTAFKEELSSSRTRLDELEERLSVFENSILVIEQQQHELFSGFAALQQHMEDVRQSERQAWWNAIAMQGAKISDDIGALKKTFQSENKSLSDALAALDNAFRVENKSLSDTIAALNNAFRAENKSLSDTIAALDTAFRAENKSLSDAIAALHNAYQAGNKSLSEDIDVERRHREEAALSLTAQVARQQEHEKLLDANIIEINKGIIELHQAAAGLTESVRNTGKIPELIDRAAKTQNRLEQFHAAIINQERRLNYAFQDLRRLAGESEDTEEDVVTVKRDYLLDDLYVSFENIFRGAREVVKDRVKIYLPYIKTAGAGNKNHPVFDLGCGRGEWLELLKDHNLVGCGVDLNRTMVDVCVDLKLDVREGDILTVLRALRNESLGAVTGFHIIEHLPYGTLVAVFDEALRVLKPGGVAIFETPNPENLIVGAYSFYLDPTHRNPLPGPLAKFLLESRGFIKAEILPLHPVDPQNLIDENTVTANRMNHYLYGPQDFGAIAWKP